MTWVKDWVETYFTLRRFLLLLFLKLIFIREQLLCNVVLVSALSATHMHWSRLPCSSFSFRSPSRNCSQPTSWEFCPCLPEIISLSVLLFMSYSHSVMLARTLEIRFSEIYGNDSYFIIWLKRKSSMIHEGFLVLSRVDFMHRKLLISKNQDSIC